MEVDEAHAVNVLAAMQASEGKVNRTFDNLLQGSWLLGGFGVRPIRSQCAVQVPQKFSDTSRVGAEVAASFSRGRCQIDPSLRILIQTDRDHHIADSTDEIAGFCADDPAVIVGFEDAPAAQIARKLTRVLPDAVERNCQRAAPEPGIRIIRGRLSHVFANRSNQSFSQTQRFSSL
jgi:hypothetical protein